MHPYETHLLKGLHLERRKTHDPRDEQFPELRTEDGRTMAVVETWAPEYGTSIAN